MWVCSLWSLWAFLQQHCTPLHPSAPLCTTRSPGTACSEMAGPHRPCCGGPPRLGRPRSAACMGAHASAHRASDPMHPVVVAICLHLWWEACMRMAGALAATGRGRLPPCAPAACIGLAALPGWCRMRWGGQGSAAPVLPPHPPACTGRGGAGAQAGGVGAGGAAVHAPHTQAPP